MRSSSQGGATSGQPLFAEGGSAPSPCRYMGQPACERMACQRVGHPEPIKNCTPVSAEFRESFADATVERVRCRRTTTPTAEFSNGESVEFDDKDSVWFITERWIKDVGQEVASNRRSAEKLVPPRGRTAFSLMVVRLSSQWHRPPLALPCSESGSFLFRRSRRRVFVGVAAAAQFHARVSEAWPAAHPTRPRNTGSLGTVRRQPSLSNCSSTIAQAARSN